MKLVIIQIVPYKMTSTYQDALAIDFVTAWASPLLWLEKVAKKNPPLSFELAWYVMETEQYGIYHVSINDGYKENLSFNIIEGDYVFLTNGKEVDLKMRKKCILLVDLMKSLEE